MKNKINQQIRNEIEKLKALKRRIGKKLTIDRFKELTNQPNISDDKAKQMIEYIEELADIIAPQFLRIQKLITQKIPVKNEKRFRKP